MFNWIIPLAIGLTGLAQAASFHYEGSPFLREVAEEALNTLPESYLDSVNKKITIKESSLKTDKLFLSEDLCKIDEGVKFGVTKRYKISISSRLVELAKSNQETFNCGHKSFRNMLKAVLIHELTHVKDNKEKISLDADFQRIVGVKRVQRNSKRKLMNQNTGASPDAYEFHNLEESLAVNVEYLVMDPEFECRKPATARFLSRKLGIPLYGKCERNSNVIVQSAFLEDNYQLATSIDPRRVYQIHYLFAGKGRALMSRWGHAMFRLVICAPFRTVPGPECLEDVSHHIALSYRAYMSEIDISYVKGVFGGYPSQLFIMRYLEVQQEYTKHELRDLFSIPLKMTETQKRDFLDLTLERFWTYQGRYYFIDNNCGTETAKHLAVALSDEESKLIGSVTPLKIYRDIIKESNNLTEGKFDDLSRQEMIEKKLLVESMYDQLNKSYQFLREYLPSFSEKDMMKFLEKTTAETRLREYEELVVNSRSTMEPTLRKQIAMKLIHFERFLAGKFLMEIPKKAIQKMNKYEELKAEVMKMGETLKLLSVQPWEVVDSYYGVPVKDEFEVQFPVFLQKRNQDVKVSLEGQMENLQNILGKKYFTNELFQLEELKKIKKLTSEFIFEVNKVQ
ncbi:MAG: DUF4105 domain-containing protein [Bacteriovoracia bacterium]